MATARHKPVTVKPHEAVADDTVPPGPDVRPNYPFTLVHYHQWDFDEAAGEWLPRLNEVRHAPGCNGCVEVGTGKNARVNPAGAITGATTKGGIVITPGDRRLGEYGNYLAAHKVRGGGLFFCLRNVEIVLLSGGRRSALAPDVGWYRDLKRHLYRSGIVPLMPREVLDTRVGTLQARLQKYRSLFQAGKVTRDALAMQTEEIEALITRYVEAYAAVADTVPTDLAPEVDGGRVAAASLAADPEVEGAAREAAARAKPRPRVSVKPAEEGA